MDFIFLVDLIIIGIAGIIIIRQHLDFFFWLFLNLFFDPGGFVSGFMGGNVFGRFNLADVVIVGIIICLASKKIDWKIIFNDRFFLKFLKLFSVYALYYFIVYGAVAPYLHNDLNYSTFLLKNRNFVYGAIILISVYVFSLRGLKYFYSITLFVGIICLSLYWITLLTGINLVPVNEVERYRGSGMMRISMSGYGYFYSLFPISIITYILSRKQKFRLKYKKYLYYGGMLMTLTLLITLTRRVFVDIVGTIIIAILITSYLFRTAKMPAIMKFAIPALLIFMMLAFTLPQYTDYVSRIAEDTFLLIATGKDTRSVGDYRLSGTGDLLAVKDSIRDNLWLGNGYTYLYWGDSPISTSLRGSFYARMADAAGEVPIYSMFFNFGLIGAVLILALYYQMGRLLLKTTKFLKRNISKYYEEPLILIISIYVILTILLKFTFRIMFLGSDFGNHGFPTFAVILGIAFGLHCKFMRSKADILSKRNKIMIKLS